MATIVSEIGEGAARAFRWWTGELAALVPDPIASRFKSGGSGIVVEVARSHWAVYRDEKDKPNLLTRIPAEELSLEAARSGLRRRLRSLGLHDRAVVLKVPADQVLVRSFALPAATASELRQAIAYQIERKTPFAADDVYFDYRVLRRDTDARQIEVEVALVQRALADDLAGQAASLGMHATTIAANSGGELAMIALPDDASKRDGTRGRVNMVLAVIAALLFAAAVYVPLDQRRAAAERIDAEMQTLKVDAEQVLQLRDSIERRRTALAFLQERKREDASAIDTLELLTELLPDDTWLLQFHLSGHRVRVSGYAPDASSLVGLIDSADAFETPRFLSPVTPIPGGNTERFNMSFMIEGGE